MCAARVASVSEQLPRVTDAPRISELRSWAPFPVTIVPSHLPTYLLIIPTPTPPGKEWTVDVAPRINQEGGRNHLQ